MKKTKTLLKISLFIIAVNLASPVYPEETSAETFTINGFVRDQESNFICQATVKLSGAATGSFVISDSGYYEFKDLPSGSYSIAAEKEGYKFEPAARKFKNLASNQEKQDFTGTPEGKTYTIEGCVMDKKGYTLREVNVKISGDVSFEGMTACDGNYAFSNLPEGNYTVEARKYGYVFKPQKKIFKKIGSDKKKEYFYGKTDINIPEDEFNIVTITEGINALGWGEYHSAGRCLCCDNILDGDCVMIGNTEKTEKLPIPQIVDGMKPWDINDLKGFFGEVTRVDAPDKYATDLYAQITLPEAKQINKVIVWTQKKDRKSMLPNCELGYLDDFERIQWVDKIENNKFNDHIFFNLKQPIITKQVLLRVYNGKNRIMEVELFTIDAGTK